jgi:hypothetical protein
VCRVGAGPCVGGGLLLPSVIGGKGGCCSWHRQLPRAWLSDASGSGAAPGTGVCHGSWKRFFHRRDSRGRPLSHPVLEGKPNANHVRARISYSRTQQLHNMDIITQCSK